MNPALRQLRPVELESTLTSPLWFGLDKATPLQRAICRLADGLPIDDLLAQPIMPPELLEQYDDEVQQRCTWEWSLGNVEAVARWARERNGVRPREFYLVGAVRAGKSVTVAALATRATQTCDLGQLLPGEVPRSAVLSLDKDRAVAVTTYVGGAVAESPVLKQHVMTSVPERYRKSVGRMEAGDTLLEHPTGHPVKLSVVAGKRAGGSLVSFWLTTAIFDEFPRMLGSSDAVVNFDHSRAAALDRLLPGGQLVGLGSPWAPMGPAFERVDRLWGRPTDTEVLVRGCGPALNPTKWTPEECRALRDSHDGEQLYRSSVLGEFVALDSQAYDIRHLKQARQTWERLQAPERANPIAVMDPATRRNAWSLVIGWVDEEGRCVIGRARQWQGSTKHPLSPKRVLREIAEEVNAYHLDTVVTDQHAVDELTELAPLSLFLREARETAEERTSQGRTLGLRLASGRLLIPNDNLVEKDLGSVQKKPRQDGTIAYVLPVTGDGRHCDYAAAIMRLMLELQDLDEVEDAAREKTYAELSEEELDALTLERFHGDDDESYIDDEGSYLDVA